MLRVIAAPLAAALLCALLLHPALAAWMLSHQRGVLFSVACAGVAAVLLRRKARAFSAFFAFLGAGILLMLALAQQRAVVSAASVAPNTAGPPGLTGPTGPFVQPSVGPNMHADAPIPSPVAPGQKQSVDAINADTRFGYVLMFAQDTPVAEIEAFRESVLKKVHLMPCVRGLSCVARLLRLFEVGSKREQVLAFDLMQDTPMAERAALLGAIGAHPLKPGVYTGTSANQASAH
jgi:hypothetical protein